MRLFVRGGWFRLFLLLGGLGTVPITTAAGPDEDAQALLKRTLRANQPWLDPSPLQGSYYLLRQEGGTIMAAAERTGPFSMAGKGVLVWYQPARPRAGRVGSLVWTPLHVIAQGTNAYTVHLVGNTNWNGTPVVAIDIGFSSAVKNQIGLGGQPSAPSYSAADYLVENVQLLIEPTQAIPLFIQTHTSPTNRVQTDVTWQFDPVFFAIDGGFAPRTIDWNAPSIFRERQEFQLFGREWVFKLGQAWWNSPPGQPEPPEPTGLVQTVELTDLAIPFPSLAVQRSAAGLVLSWPTHGRAGIALEAADAPQGPWSTLLAQVSADITNVVVSIPTSRLSQFYRLRK